MYIQNRHTETERLVLIQFSIMFLCITIKFHFNRYLCTQKKFYTNGCSSSGGGGGFGLQFVPMYFIFVNVW